MTSNIILNNRGQDVGYVRDMVDFGLREEEDFLKYFQETFNIILTKTGQYSSYDFKINDNIYIEFKSIKLKPFNINDDGKITLYPHFYIGVDKIDNYKIIYNSCFNKIKDDTLKKTPTFLYIIKVRYFLKKVINGIETDIEGNRYIFASISPYKVMSACKITTGCDNTNDTKQHYLIPSKWFNNLSYINDIL